ncbi:hypothetical protein BS78_03G181800 [Paspalum vaginatum]|nr:hypothetical protein BS78_03G181800 [Paspalum vaginatum]
MAAGRLAVVVAAAVLAVAGASDDDCFANCFKNCVGGDKSMADYCNYACGMTCIPDDDALQLGTAALPRPLRTAAGGGGGAARRSAALPDKPFRKSKTQDDGAVRPAGEPDPDDVIRPALGPVRPPPVIVVGE